MRFPIVCFVTAMASTAVGQVTVDGKVPGELWRTDNVSGEVEVFHILGRTTVMPVKDAWVTLDGDTVTIGARTDEPVLDGKSRKGYQMANMSGNRQSDFPTYIQTITDRHSSGIGEEQDIRITRTVMITWTEGKPKSMIFTELSYADFDIAAFVAEVSAGHSELAKRSIEGLEEFDEKGFRQRTFPAVFK